MAPEQIDGGDVDGRSDIYSLGAVMYEMATGTPPFDGESVLTVLMKHKSGGADAHPRPPGAHPTRAAEP